MAHPQVESLITGLPFRLRESVSGYVAAVEAALPELQHEAHQKLNPNARAEFLTLVAIRRIWASVNSQHWIINKSVAIARERGLEGFRAGRDQFSSDSLATNEAKRLREQMEALIEKLELSAVMQMQLSELIRYVNRSQQ